jgi:hypothetical protein
VELLRELVSEPRPGGNCRGSGLGANDGVLGVGVLSPRNYGLVYVRLSSVCAIAPRRL